MTYIYHITHIENLNEILLHDGLYSDSEINRRGLSSVCIAYSALKERRARTQVPVSARGALDEYVPFYFCKRSPMLYAIHCGSVKNYLGGQNEIIYLVSSAENVDSAGCDWCFTDGHAVEAITSFYHSLADLDVVDWSVIYNWSWHNTDSDFDRKRRKQAEFLVYLSFPWNLIDSIAVIDDYMKNRVNNIISAASYKPLVKIEKGWYY